MKIKEFKEKWNETHLDLVLEYLSDWIELLKSEYPSATETLENLNITFDNLELSNGWLGQEYVINYLDQNRDIKIKSIYALDKQNAIDQLIDYLEIRSVKCEGEEV